MKKIISTLILFVLISCGGKYYNNTTSGIKTKNTSSEIFLSVIRENVIYVSERKELKNKNNCKFEIIETDSSILFQTSRISINIPVNGNNINFTKADGKDIKNEDLCYGLGEGKFLLSEKGLGKYWDNDGYYFIAASNIDSVLSTYNSITGNTEIIPKWALGHWQGIEDKDPVSEMKKLREEHFGVDNIISKKNKDDNTSKIISDMHGQLVSIENGFSWQVKGTNETRDFTFSKNNTINNIQRSDWQSLKNSVDSIILYSLSGFKYRTSVIKNDVKDQKLFNRWYQFAVFTPMLCSFCDLPRDNGILYYNRLRYGMVPYIYSLCKMSSIIKPVSCSKDVKYQYMFGPSMMVCPVFEQNKREVFLPEGNIWYDYNHPKKIYTGGQTINIEAEDDRIPVFIPGGGIIIYGQKNEYVTEIRKDDKVDLDIDIYSGKDNYFEIYDDDGTSDNYKKGEYSIVPVRYIDSPRTIIIGSRKGKFSGMIPNRNIHVAVYNNGIMKAINVYYEGAKIKISL